LDILSPHDKIFLREKIHTDSYGLILTHQNPDGDAIGSSLGLKHALDHAGISSQVVVPNDFPAFLKWIPGSHEILVYERHKKSILDLIERAIFIFFLDFNDISRIPRLEKQISDSRAFKILIDHHPDPGDFADLVISDISVSSTAELVYLFIKQVFGRKYIDRIVAECLYTGIMTDTGSFSFNSSNPSTFEVLSEILSFGIDKDQIYSNVYDNFSEQRMKLLGYCLDKKMVVLPDFQSAYITLTNEEKKNYSFQPGDSEGFVNYPLSVKGIYFSTFFMENGQKVKISFRSKGNIPVNLFASRYFGGGGHKNAAGGESELSMEKTIERFTSLLPVFFDDIKDATND
jgi:bifunctional oligoribonuclease and PAP phosphatase NrnA